MHSFLSRLKARCSRHKGELLSIAVHLCLLLSLVGGVPRSSKVLTPYRLPGTARGVSMLTYYSPGSLHVVTSKEPIKSPEKTRPAPAIHLDLRASRPVQSEAAQSQTGIGMSAQSGLGEGDITIALESYFPYPTPDLSSLPHGTKGDVILNAVIDENGKISELTLLKGLGSPVDESVIATVQQWRYTPAMKKGVPVASERELHFHYERG
jgi:periplasmic protein TonB